MLFGRIFKLEVIEYVVGLSMGLDIIYVVIDFLLSSFCKIYFENLNII